MSKQHPKKPAPKTAMEMQGSQTQPTPKNVLTNTVFNRSEIPNEHNAAKAFLKAKVDDLFQCSYASGGRTPIDIGFQVVGQFGEFRVISLMEKIEDPAVAVAVNLNPTTSSQIQG